MAKFYEKAEFKKNWTAFRNRFRKTPEPEIYLLDYGALRSHENHRYRHLAPARPMQETEDFLSRIRRKSIGALDITGIDVDEEFELRPLLVGFRNPTFKIHFVYQSYDQDLEMTWLLFGDRHDAMQVKLRV